MKIKNDIPFIEDPFELLMLKSCKPFTIKCVKCGQIQTRLFKRNRLEDYKSMKCSSCLNQNIFYILHQNMTQHTLPRTYQEFLNNNLNKHSNNFLFL